MGLTRIRNEEKRDGDREGNKCNCTLRFFLRGGHSDEVYVQNYRQKKNTVAGLKYKNIIREEENQEQQRDKRTQIRSID